jgi:hypothetical protein
LIERGVLQAELDDYAAQAANAQQQAAVWQQKAMMAEGARQAVAALIAKLDAAAEAAP